MISGSSADRSPLRIISSRAKKPEREGMNKEGDAATSVEAGGVAHEADQGAGPRKKPVKKRGAAQMCPGIGIIRSKSGRPATPPKFEYF